MNDFKEQVEKNSKNICALMLTFPSTFGVFEEESDQLSQIIK